MFVNLIFLRLVILANQIQKLQFLDQEQIKMDYLFSQMAINNESDEQNFLNRNFKLLQKIEEFDTYFNLEQKYHILKRNINETLLLVNEKSQLKALLSFNDYLINDKFIVKISDFLIQLPQENCEKFFFLQDDHLLAVCKENENNLQILILNKLTILDQQQLMYELKCEIGFSIIDKVLIIYGKNCSDIYIYKIEIDLENYKLNIQQFSELMTKLAEVQNNLSQRLIQLEICQIDQLHIAFQKLMFYYSTQLKLLYQNYNVKGENLEIYKIVNYCKNWYFVLINKETSNFKPKLGTLVFKNKFNLSTQGYKQSYVSPHFLLHHYDDKVAVQLNEELHFSLHSKFEEFFQLYDMPYFVSVESNGKLSIFQLQKGGIYLKEMKSKKIGIYQILNQTTEIINVEHFDIHNLQLKINPQNTPIILKNFDIQINISLNYIQETLPLTLFSIEQNGDKIEFNEGFEGFNEFNIKDESIKNVWFLNLEQNQNIIIQEFKTYLLLKMFLDQQLIKEFNIIILQNYILTLVNAFQQSIIIIYDYFIQIYNIQNFQITTWVSNYNDKIINANIYEQVMWILFHSCILHEIIINEPLNYESFQNFIVHKGCRLNSFYNNNLIIQDQEIYYKNNNKIIDQLKFETRMIDLVITRVFDQIINEQFLTFIQEEQGIKISLYIIESSNFIHLYDLPFYQYKPIQPLNYKLQSRFFIIVVLDDSDEKCLLIYNIKNQGKKSLIKIIKFHKEEIVYNFIENQDIILYIKDGKIKFNKIQEINIKLNYFDLINNKMDFYTIKNLNIKFASPIKSVNQYICMPLKILHLNTIQTLGIINNKVQLINQNGYLNLSNIYGSIDKIQLIHNNSIIEMNQVNYTWNRIQCIFYNNDFCQISEKRSMINFFSKGQNIYTQQFINNIQAAIYDKEQSKYILICFSKVTYNITYYEIYLKFSNNNNIKITKIGKLEQNFEFHYDDFHTYVRSYYFLDLVIFSNKGMQNLFIFKNKDVLIRLNDIEKVITQQILDCYQLNETTYMFAQINQKQELEFFLIQINIFDNVPNLTILFKQAFDNFNQIDDFNLKSTLLIIKIISINIQSNQSFNMQYLQCGQYLSFCVIKILRFKQAHYIDQNITALLRLETFNFKIEIVYSDSEIVIFEQKINQDLFLDIYDISELNFKRELDYIQRIPIQNHTKIEKYNQSHYSIYSNQKVSLIQFKKYQLEKMNDSVTNNISLQFINQVSKLTINISISNLNQNQNFLNNQGKLIIIILTFIFIIFQLQIKKKRKEN